MKALQITDDTRDTVKERSGGVCEVCQAERATQMHHRVPRKMGGSRNPDLHLPSKILHLGNLCHDYIENNREEALDEGWLLKDVNDDRPVKIPDRYVRFDDDGGFAGYGPEKPIVEHAEGCDLWNSLPCSCGGVA